MQKKISCPHFPLCCSVHNVVDETGASFLKAKNFFKEWAAIDLVLSIGSVTGWRGRAKLAVRKGKGVPVIGLFTSGTHEVFSIPHCSAHHPKINEAVACVQQVLDNSVCYDEKTHRGELRYLQAVVERKSNTVQLTLVINAVDEKRIHFWRLFAHTLFQKGLWHSMWLNIHTTTSNTIFGKEWIHVVGKDVVWEEIAGSAIPFGPAHFGQSNVEMFEQLIVDLRSWIPSGLSAVELYAGVGAIGLCLAQKCKAVLMTEVVGAARPYFELAKKKLEPSIQNKLIYHTLPAEKSFSFIEEADLLIVDPPRKGLDRAVIESIDGAKNLQYVAYVSCSWDSFERDCTQLLASGWRIAQAKSYLFFPGTDHIEILALFTKKSG